jgi:uncharacterized protein YndB with AHSA1/START domain
VAKKQRPENEIHLTRLYDAPVHLVWDAWTDPKQAAQWWGPRGFTITTHSKDLRVGGHWAYTMHGPDGTNYENKTVYHEVKKHEKLVYDHGGNDDRPPLFQVSVTFEDLGHQTKMDMTMRLKTADEAKETRKRIKNASGNSTWDRLGEYLAKQTKGSDPFIINRAFDTNIASVYAAWTNPAQLAQWLPPAGFAMRFQHADIRTGGESFFSLESADARICVRARYQTVQPTSLIIYEQTFCNAEGKPVRHPGAETFPMTLRHTIFFRAESEEETVVTVQAEIIGEVSSEEVAAFVAERGGMTIGWNGSFDVLETILVTPPPAPVQSAAL